MQPADSPPAKSVATSYHLRISRLTVDKLGVKLYDKASAVVAELIANGYDADAEEVMVRLPLNTLLADKDAEGKARDGGYIIEVEDTGHGMTPDEARSYYLLVGRDRRVVPQGGISRDKNRPVMGRKGIGKLAPFGICKRIEVLSAGGPRTAQGYLVSHFVMDYDRILSNSDAPVELDRGVEDETFRPEHGTTIRLSNFLPKRVPDADTFHRQLAARFVFAQPDFRIVVEDTRNPDINPAREVTPLSVPVHDSTRINLATRSLRTDEGEVLPVTGWLAMAKESYKDEETSGVRIYARDKIVGTTRDFEQPAGFTGEFTIRSYLVGEIHAEWLDYDQGEDLIRSDRQGILWDSDYGRALRRWGGDLIKEIGRLSKHPRRVRTQKAFMEKSDFAEIAKQRYSQPEIVKTAVELASQLGGYAVEDELEDDEYVSGLTEFVLSVAPHRALIDAFKDFQKKVARGERSLDDLLELFGKTRVAEMASYCQIAVQRVQSIRELAALVHDADDQDEGKYQDLIERAPWLIEPTWSVISQNQQLDTFKLAFAKFWKRRTDEDVVFTIGSGTKRPDFTLVNVGQMLHIVEIKKGGHTFDDTDFDRLINYVVAFTDFFKDHPKLAAEFPGGWRIDLVADGVKLKLPANHKAFTTYQEEGLVVSSSWVDFLTHAQTSHQMLLDINDEHGRSMFATLGVTPQPMVLTAPAGVDQAPKNTHLQLKDKEDHGA